MADVDMQRGDRIAKLRKEHGWNQDEFASRVGICRQSMSSIENVNITVRRSRLSGVARATIPDKQSHHVMRYCAFAGSKP